MVQWLGVFTVWIATISSLSFASSANYQQPCQSVRKEQQADCITFYAQTCSQYLKKADNDCAVGGDEDVAIMQYYDSAQLKVAEGGPSFIPNTQTAKSACRLAQPERASQVNSCGKYQSECYKEKFEGDPRVTCESFKVSGGANQGRGICTALQANRNQIGVKQGLEIATCNSANSIGQETADRDLSNAKPLGSGYGGGTNANPYTGPQSQGCQDFCAGKAAGQRPRDMTGSISQTCGC